jgi:excisionase family DNA binding protein|tara:strand:+ start:589 stop:789 length:201 start_codon:yes stop_codon:yes gene_type:complete
MSAETEFIQNIVKQVLFYNKTMTLNECCAYLNKNRKTIISAIDRNEIEATKIGKQYLIPMIQFIPS